VTNAVQLSDIFNALDQKTRTAFQVWQQSLAQAVQGNDQNLNNVLGNLPTFAADATDILQVLDIQHMAVVHLVQNGGTVFAALSQDRSALHNLITTGEETFRTTADNQDKLAQIFRVFPTFLNESKLTMARLKTFSLDADPLFKQLVPVAQDLRPTLHSVKVLAPYLQRFFVKLGPLITVSKTGLPAVRDFLLGAKPLLASLGGPTGFLEQLNPILTWLSLHQQLISDFISNGATGIAAKTSSLPAGGSGLTCPVQGGSPQPCGHYLRQFGPTGPETLSLYAERAKTNRGDVYPPPLWLGDPRVLSDGKQILNSWDCKNTGAPGDGSTVRSDAPPPNGTPACWVAPPLPGAAGPSQTPHVTPAHYSSK